MSPSRFLARVSLLLALMGPLGGAAALMFGAIALWDGPAFHPLPPHADAGIYLGTWATLVCLGFMVASPFRLAAAIALARHARWRWIAAGLAAVIGCLDLSVGPLMAVLTTRVWRQETESKPAATA